MKTNLHALIDWIDTYYKGDVHSISDALTHAIYMLLYLPEDCFNRSEVQDVAYVLREISLLIKEGGPTDGQSTTDLPKSLENKH